MDAQDAVDERAAGAMVFLSGDLDRTSLERAVRTGTLQRLRRGAYGRVFTGEKHVRARIHARQQMTAINRQLAGPTWFSHTSAALLHGLPLLHPPVTTHVTQQHRPSSRADRSLVRHTRPLRAGDTTVLDNLPVTSLRRTSIDCAITLPPLEALTVLDGALAQGLTIEVATTELRRLHGSSGTARARWCLERADAHAESAGETATRFTLLRHGLHVSQLQIPVRTRRSRYRIDLGWPELKIGIEFDGKIKYTRMAGSDPAEVIFREKRRQDDLERAGWVIIRVTWADLLRPAAFIAEVHRRLNERSWQAYAV
ncbi:MAG TPA: hypothetical protein VK086_05750 [Ruania sp.]|nr:hypothetical protein [Ruania sp.]